MYRNNVTWLDRFCARHPNFGIPNLMAYVAVANVALAVMDNFSMGAISLSDMLYFSRSAILSGQFWRLFTFVLVPENSSLFYAAIGAYFYYWIGSTLEREWGTAKFSVFYFSGVALNVLYGMAVGYASMYYVNLSLFFAFATLFGEMRVLLFFIIPIKMKWLAIVDAALFGWSFLSNLMVGQYFRAFLPVVAILNYFIFFWQDFRWLFAKVKRRSDPTVINFKKAQKELKKKAEETHGYIHKCAVCGVTDADNPDLEFRYCSKCDGYYCYCMEHINNHVHVKQ